MVTTRPPASSQPMKSPAAVVRVDDVAERVQRPVHRGEGEGGHPPGRPPHRRQQQQAVRHLERRVVEDVVVVAHAERPERVEERSRARTS